MKSSAPIWDFLQGIGAFLIFCYISSYSILSTENLIQGGDGSSIRPSFEVFTQVYDLSMGVYSGVVAIAIMIAFLLWFCYLGIAFNFEYYKTHLDGVHKGAGGTFMTLIAILIAVDSYANWNSLSRNSWPWYWQLTVTIGIAIALMYLGHFAIVHLIRGWKGMKGN